MTNEIKKGDLITVPKGTPFYSQNSARPNGATAQTMMVEVVKAYQEVRALYGRLPNLPATIVWLDSDGYSMEVETSKVTKKEGA